MPRKKYIKLVFAGIVVFLILIYLVSNRYYSFYGNRIIPVDIGKQSINAEIVASDDKLAEGLGMRNNLCSSCGMLFEFPRFGRYSFWMKNMRFPLDIIWLSRGRIVYFEKNIAPDFAGILVPPADADMVLEISAGNLDKYGIRIGDMVNF